MKAFFYNGTGTNLHHELDIPEEYTDDNNAVIINGLYYYTEYFYIPEDWVEYRETPKELLTDCIFIEYKNGKWTNYDHT
jgi:hypothetical protein